MTQISPAKLESCRRNSLKSTGPKTPEGRAKSSMNALKHGMRSKKLALFREESYEFENRRMKWMSIADPDDDIGEFLVNQFVSQSFELEQVERAQRERLTRLIEDSDESEFDAVHELGKRLFFDPTGPTPMYGNRPDGRRKLRTSWNGQAVDPNDPAVLVRQLESSAMGCCQMRDCWEELRAQLAPGKFWQSHDRLKAIRLLGRQPLDAIEDRQVAEIFVASSALDPAGHKPFDDLLSDMGTTEHVHYRKTVRARWPDLVSADDTAGCRQILIDLADRNIERLNAKLEVYEQNADSSAQRTVDRLGFDQSPDGNRIRQYKTKCTSGFFRAIEAYRKYQGKKRAEGRERQDEYAGMMAKDGKRRPLDAARWPQQMDASHHVPDRSFAMGMGHAERETFEPSDEGKPDPPFLPPSLLIPPPFCSDGGKPDPPFLPPSLLIPPPFCSDGGKPDPPFLPPSLLIAPPFCSDEGKPDPPFLPPSLLIPPPFCSDGGKPDPPFLPPSLLIPPPFCSDGITPPEGPTPDAVAGNAGPNSSDTDAAVQRGDATSLLGENSENATNEPKLDESVIIIQHTEPVGVVANSGVDSGLDKPEEKPVKAERNDSTSRGTPPEPAFRPPAQIAGEAHHGARSVGHAARYEEHLRRFGSPGITRARDPDPSSRSIGQPAPEAQSICPAAPVNRFNAPRRLSRTPYPSRSNRLPCGFSLVHRGERIETRHPGECGQACCRLQSGGLNRAFLTLTLEASHAAKSHPLTVPQTQRQDGPDPPRQIRFGTPAIPELPPRCGAADAPRDRGLVGCRSARTE